MPMEWTELQRVEPATEYSRIGYVAGELWPAPPEHLKPEDLLALFRRIPDGTGRSAYAAELAKAAK
ncbi:MAG TPA: hypothetical protein VN927_05935 [Gemmatimonadaceae bacterium]|nr:hypothetical protein [Gemmatimonadaceae bacterium]